MKYSVGKVAVFAGVTVRTLHHYEEIGLLLPSDRSPSGYRLYDEGDLERLQQILFYRALGFSLEDIGPILEGETDAMEHLLTQRRMLIERISELHRLPPTRVSPPAQASLGDEGHPACPRCH